jgi:ketosteroid isomerase-like protein
MRKHVLLFIALGSVLVVPPAFAAAPGEKAVLAALEAWKDAMLKKDRAALEKVFHPDLSYGHSSAMVETKEQAIPHIVDSAGWEAIEFADTTVRVRGNVALVNGKTDMHQRGKDKVTISKLTVLTVWVKGGAGWQMIARQAVRRPDDPQVIAAHAALAAARTGSPPTPAHPPAPAPGK